MEKTFESHNCALCFIWWIVMWLEELTGGGAKRSSARRVQSQSGNLTPNALERGLA